MRYAFINALILFLASCSPLSPILPTPVIVLQTVMVERIVTPTFTPTSTSTATPRLQNTTTPTPIQTQIGRAHV